jgi:hypothetical protein
MNLVQAASNWAKRMTAKRATSGQVVPLTAGIVFLTAVLAALRLCAGSWSPETINPPEQDYKLALYAAMTPSPDLVSHALDKLDHPTVVVTWTNSQWVPSFRQNGSAGEPVAGTDLWVTDAASLKTFCQEYVRSHGTDRYTLAMRLKQRLGLLRKIAAVYRESPPEVLSCHNLPHRADIFVLFRT